jgi:hypothetical protein
MGALQQKLPSRVAFNLLVEDLAEIQDLFKNKINIIL